MKDGQSESLTLNATAASLLGFLHEKPMTGYDLLQTAIERIGNFWSLTRSQVYSELDKLAKQGYIEVTARGQRDSRTFTINDRGKKAFAQWLDDKPAREQIRFPMLLTVSFASYIDQRKLLSMLQEYRQAHSLQLEAYQQQQSILCTIPEAKDGLKTLSFGIAYEKMTLAWIDDTLRELLNEAESSA